MGNVEETRPNPHTPKQNINSPDRPEPQRSEIGGATEGVKEDQALSAQRAIGLPYVELVVTATEE